MSRAGGVIATIAFVGVASAAVVWGPGIVASVTAKPAPNVCTVSAESGTFALSAERADNAAIIAASGWTHGFDENGVTVALATALQESGLRNLDYGDRDSVGLFQQRTSQGWGTVEQIMDPRYAATMFYNALGKVKGWDGLPVTEAAQAVQRSGFPEAYAKHEPAARAWANALGGVEGTVTCDLSDAAPTAPQALSDRIALDFPDVGYAIDALGYDGDTTIIGIRPPDATDQALNRIQAWVTATASTTGVTWADVHGSRWTRDGGWKQEDPDPQYADYAGVRVGLQTS